MKQDTFKIKEGLVGLILRFEMGIHGGVAALNNMKPADKEKVLREVVERAYIKLN